MEDTQEEDILEADTLVEEDTLVEVVDTQEEEEDIPAEEEDTLVGVIQAAEVTMVVVVDTVVMGAATVDTMGAEAVVHMLVRWLRNTFKESLITRNIWFSIILCY